MRPLIEIDRDVLRLAEAQYGVVARRQLLELGLSADIIKRRRRNGRLVTLHPGVYALGHRALRPEARWLAVVLSVGKHAVLSHRSAARLWGLRPWSGPVEITVRSTAGLADIDDRRVHTSIDLPDHEVVVERGIPTTAVPRTLLDLAAVVPPHHLRRAVERAEQLELFDLAALDAVLAAHPRRPGSPALRALLQDARRHDLPRTRSDVEAAMLQLCLDHGLPRPVVNRRDDGREVDFRWPGSTLLVEVDGYATHRTRRAFAADRARDRLALREGLRVARFPAAEIQPEAASIAEELRALLAP